MVFANYNGRPHAKPEPETLEHKLRRLLRDTWMMIEHATNIDFHNGVEHMGIDEGDVRGWEFYHKLRKEIEELGIL